MKKLISILLCLALLILPGCGEKQEIYLLLTPGNADLGMASNVVLEPEEPPYNLGGWTIDDIVWWDLELPQKDTYTLRFWYSMPSDYAPCTAWLAAVPMEGDVVSAEPVFVPTSADGGWETYDYLDVTMELPAGLMSLSLETFDIPDGQDYFINLRVVEIFNGELVPLEPGIIEELPELPRETDPEPEIEPEIEPETEADGTWWTCRGGFPGSGTGLAAAFFLNEENWKCDLYNKYGQRFGTYPYSTDGDKLTVYIGGEIGEFTYLVEDDCLVDSVYDTIEFELLGEPEFWELPYFDGTWYRCGDPENPSFYEIEDGRYRRYFGSRDEASLEDEGLCLFDTVIHYTDYTQEQAFYDVAHFFMEGEEDIQFYPVMDGVAFYMEEDLDYKAYVFEGSSAADYAWAWMAVEDLMNGFVSGTASDGTEIRMHFEGYGFYMTMTTPDGESLEDAPFGKWVLRNDGCIELEAVDGTWLELPIPQDGDTFVYPVNGEDVTLELTV